MVKYLKGDDPFSFPRDFGFHGSAEGRHDPRSHPQPKDGDYGDGLAKGGPVERYDMGGSVAAPPRPPRGRGVRVPRAGALSAARSQTHVPVEAAGKAAAIAFRLGQALGQRQGGKMPGGPAPLAGMPGQGSTMPGLPDSGLADPTAPGAPTPTPMREGGHFLQKAVKRPGRLKNLAKRHGISLGEEIAHDRHSSDPSLRAAADLGARFRSGEFRKRKD